MARRHYKGPLLPVRILPANYLGQKVWRRRLQVVGEIAPQMASPGEK